MEHKYYICAHCGNIITYVKSSGVSTMCCGALMKEIIAGTIEASVEKHVPVYNVANNIVSVTIGSVEHPMLEEHYIEWISLTTNKGVQLKHLQPNQKPEITFALIDGEVVETVYAYCNLHGLWKA